MPKSFRLNQEAQEVLKALSEDYDLSEGKILNILLTAPHYVDNKPLEIHATTGGRAARIVIERYFISKLGKETRSSSSSNSSPSSSVWASWPAEEIASGDDVSATH